MSATPPPPPGPPQPGGAYGPPQASGAVGPPPVGYPTGYPAQPYGYYPAARLPFKRNAFLIVAQVLAIIQGVLGLLVGLGIILLGVAGPGRLQDYINSHPGVFNNNNGVDFVNVATGVFIGIGVFVLVLFTIVLILGVAAGRPSQVARWILAILEVLFLLGSLRILGAGNTSSVAAIVQLVWEGLIIIGLIIWPATYAAYARRNLPQRPVTA